MLTQTIPRWLAVIAITLPTTLAGAQEMKLSRSQLKLVVDVEISMQEPGYVQLVAIKEGEQIDKGQLLIELHATLHRADLKLAQKEVEAAEIRSENDVDRRYAEKTREVSQKEFESSRLANDSFTGTVTRTELERLALTVHKSTLAAEQAMRDEQVAHADLQARRAAM